MTNYYEILTVRQNASAQEIKRAFRERAKQLHPDVAGDSGASQMRKLLAAYQTLSNRDRRYEYDRAYNRFAAKNRFDYRTFLMERQDDPSNQAKLIFFELLHLEEDAALTIWYNSGGIDFPMEKYMDREDWMDCSFILAEELAKREKFYEAFVLLVSIIREERRLPYFRHFAREVEVFLKELVRLQLRHAVDTQTYLECLEALLSLGFRKSYQGQILRLITKHSVSGQGQKKQKTRQVAAIDSIEE
ncbi:MAG: J domain-containing protein [Treponema sp.]|jgi:curved DNA-binding protein CbpA|nr:J domain-containing protein [Treponema sp.]